MIVYKATNILNGSMYIGKTVGKLSSTIRRHCSIKNKSKFANAIRKYGIENFNWEIIDSSATTNSELLMLEVKYIAQFGTHSEDHYNMTIGGDGGSGNPCPNHVKDILRKIYKGKSKSESHKQNIKNGWSKREPMSQETKDKIAKTLLGKKRPAFAQETINKMKKPKSEQAKLNMKLSWERRLSNKINNL